MEQQQANKYLETISCPFCSSTQATKHRNLADIVRCNSCGTVYLRSRLKPEIQNTIYQVYSNKGSHAEIPETREQVQTSPLRRDSFLNELTEYCKPEGKLLDVGCSWGAFLDNARSRGFKVSGIEVTKKAAAYANEHLGIDVDIQDLMEKSLVKSSFRAVTMIHSLEHLGNPAASILKVYDILQPGGFYAGIVPNIESFTSNALKDSWEWLDPFHHLVHFSPATLRQHLENSGFIVEKLYTSNGDYNFDQLSKTIAQVYGINNTDDIRQKIEEINAQEMGEEIHFIAYKPHAKEPLQDEDLDIQSNISTDIPNTDSREIITDNAVEHKNTNNTDNTVIIKIEKDMDVDKVLFTNFVQNQGRELIIEDPECLLPDYSTNWNGVKVIRPDKEDKPAAETEKVNKVPNIIDSIPDTDIMQEKHNNTNIDNTFFGFDFTPEASENIPATPPPKAEETEFQEITESPAQETQTPQAVGTKQLNIVWEGSQFLYHSLALINREQCNNIIDSQAAELTIIPYEEDTFEPTGNEKYMRLQEHDIRHKPRPNTPVEDLPYVWIRHQWPPKAEEPRGAKWIIMQPWEYSVLRSDFVDIFKNADEIWTPSMFSRQSMLNSGIDFDKVHVIPNGINPQLFSPDGEKFNLPTRKRLKFLFVGGTIFRKGIDILLSAYIRIFKAKDNVSLIIKDMGGDSFYQGQTAREQIDRIKQNPEAPEIIYMNNDMTEEEIASLYRACDVFISPYRGEGFSLPTLEAMACGLPVLVTEGGPTEDYVCDMTGWKIKSESRSVGRKMGEVDFTDEAFLFEPRLEEIIRIMDLIYNDPSYLKSMGIIASSRARSEWTWNKSTMKIFTRLDHLYGTNMARSSREKLQDHDDIFIMLGKAEEFYQNNDYELALDYLGQIIDSGQCPADYLVDALNRRAWIYFEQNNLALAYENANRSGELKANPDSIYIKSKIFREQEKNEEALDLQTKLFENWNKLKFDSFINISLDMLLCDTADIFFDLEDNENAFKLYSEALKYNNESDRACFGTANCFLLAGLEKEARNMLQWTLKLKPDHSQAQEALKELDDTSPGIE